MLDAEFISTVGDKVPDLEKLTWQAFFMNNLLLVTVGNLIGGTVLVAAVCWAIFLRPEKRIGI